MSLVLYKKSVGYLPITLFLMKHDGYSHTFELVLGYFVGPIHEFHHIGENPNKPPGHNKFEECFA